MNESPLNDLIFDSKIWKKDSQDEKEESLNNTIQNKQSKNNKRSKNNSYNSSNNNSNSNNTNSNNSENNNNSININYMLNNKQKNNKNNGNNGKKLTLPISSIPYSLKLKKDKNNTKAIKKPLETKKILQNLPTFNYKSKEQSTNLFDKIKDKFSKEKKLNFKNKTRDKKIIKKIMNNKE